jgi:CRP-like cAMP-binding protein
MRRLTEREWTSLIGGHPELDALPAGLRLHADDVVAAAGRSLFRQGTRPARIFWVLEGEIRLVRRSRKGAEVVLQRTSSGFMAEASLDSPRYHCDALAAFDSRLIAFPIDLFRQALSEEGRFRAFWMGRLAREVRLLRSQCERLALRSAAERIEHYIGSEGDNGRLELSRSRKAWAAELGLTHEALYRALAGLRRSGRLSTVEKKGTLVLSLRVRP